MSEQPVDHQTKIMDKDPFQISMAAFLSAFIVTLLLLCISGVIYIMYKSNEKNTHDLLYSKTKLLFETLENSIEQRLDPPRYQIDGIARQIESGAVDIKDWQRISDLMKGSLTALPHVRGLGLFDQKLVSHWVERTQDGSYEASIDDLSQEPNLIAAFARIDQRRTVYWGPIIFPGDLGYGLINLRRPVWLKGKLQGLLATTISIPEFSQIVNDIGQNLGWTSFILEGPNDVLAHSSLIEPPTDLNSANPLLDLTKLDDGVIRLIWMGKSVDGFKKLKDSGVNLVEIKYDGNLYLLMYKKISRSGAPDWIIGGYIPAKIFTKEVQRLKKSALLGALVLVVAIIGALMIAKILSRPIKSVSRYARLLGQLELEDIKPLAQSRIKEINEQVSAFNTMIAGLRSFETYVPKQFVKKLREEGFGQHVPPAELEVAVMFTDLVGFSTSAEQLTAHETAEYLNHHFSLVGKCIDDNEGLIDKFIGDAVMAFWGAPKAMSDPAGKACSAALAIRKEISEENQLRRVAGEAPIKMRIGIHFGKVIAGNIGSPDRVNYTVVGDTVNLAQRLEAYGKNIEPSDDVEILISREVLDAVVSDFHTESIGIQKVKGRKADTEIFRLHSKQN